MREKIKSYVIDNNHLLENNSSRTCKARRFEVDKILFRSFILCLFTVFFFCCPFPFTLILNKKSLFSSLYFVFSLIPLCKLRLKIYARRTHGNAQAIFFFFTVFFSFTPIVETATENSVFLKFLSFSSFLFS